MFFCPHCGHLSATSRCTRCHLPSISTGRLIMRRHGWPSLLMRIAVFASFFSMFSMLVTGSIWGMAVGWLGGGLLAGAFFVLSRERAYDR